MTLPRRALLIAAPALALAACTSRPSATTTPDTPTAPTPTETTEQPHASDGGSSTAPDPSDAGATVDPDEVRVDEPMPAAADEKSSQAATEAATSTMKVWVKGSTMDEQDWRKELNATLTPAGQTVASRTWGYRITDTKLTGEAEAVRANEDSAVLRITANENTYELTVVRTTGDTWLTSNITTVTE